MLGRMIGSDTIEIVTPAMISDRGTLRPSYEASDGATTVTVSGCSMQPMEGLIDREGREAVKVVYVLYAPPGTILVDLARVEYAGRRFLLTSPAWDWNVGSVAHVRAELAEWKG